MVISSCRLMKMWSARSASKTTLISVSNVVTDSVAIVLKITSHFKSMRENLQVSLACRKGAIQRYRPLSFLTCSASSQKSSLKSKTSLLSKSWKMTFWNGFVPLKAAKGWCGRLGSASKPCNALSAAPGCASSAKRNGMAAALHAKKIWKISMALMESVFVQCAALRFQKPMGATTWFANTVASSSAGIA